MEFEWTQLVWLTAVAVVNKVAIDHLKRPIAKYVNGRRASDDLEPVNLWWIPYVALVTGGAICWASDINMFRSIETMPMWLGRILTAIAAGGGTQFIHELLKETRDALRAVVGILAGDDAEYEAAPSLSPTVQRRLNHFVGRK